MISEIISSKRPARISSKATRRGETNNRPSRVRGVAVTGSRARPGWRRLGYVGGKFSHDFLAHANVIDKEADSRHLIFEGISVDEDGKQYYLDAHVAYRRACLNAIEYLKKFGYTGEQGYAILGTAPVEGRISGIVDIPNACATLYLPTEIFSFDIRPCSEGPVVKLDGRVDLAAVS